MVTVRPAAARDSREERPQCKKPRGQMGPAVARAALRLLFVAVAAVLPALDAGLPARAGNPQYLSVRMPSDVLSAFWGQSTAIYAHVLLPDSCYKQPERRYPVLHWIQGFDGYGDPDPTETLSWQRAMRAFDSEFILIFLDGTFRGGHQEFADSANNGSWGTALTSEFIP